MTYIGFHDGNDAGIAVISDSGEVLFACNEERLNRKKLYVGMPELSLSLFRKKFKHYTKDTNVSNLQYVLSTQTYFGTSVHRNFFNEKLGIQHLSVLFPLMQNVRTMISFFERHILRSDWLKLSIFMKQMKISNAKGVDHHLAHAASAYYTSYHLTDVSPFQRSLIITMDGYGDGYSTTVCVGEGKEIQRIAAFKWGESIAHAYSRITQYYGFTPHKHEGKITGLAAYGNPDICYDIFKSLITYKDGSISSNPLFVIGFNKNKLDKIFGDYSREDVCAGLQKRCEDVMVSMVTYWFKKTGCLSLCLAGGVFANVRINMVLSQLPNIQHIYIFPHMGDGGLALGACFAKSKPKPFALKHVYFGPEYTDEMILRALSKNKKISYKKISYIEKEIALLLSQGNVVARFCGKMEYGPRALGNRSILYQTTDKSVNEWLNKRLKRTEFMPFAPATLDEDFNSCYEGTNNSVLTSRYMNIAYPCTSFMKKTSPAVVHVDGTARPQRVCEDTNQSFYRIIFEYKRLTGIPSVLNTSFNMHEEPIVCTPQDALRSFLSADIDYLAIGNYMVMKK